MTIEIETSATRRALLKSGGIAACAMIVPGMVSAGVRIAAPRPAPIPVTSGIRKVPAAPITSSRVVRPELLRRAVASLQRHASRGVKQDRIAIADFAAPSGKPRFHFVDLSTGASRSLLVAHGSGSDPAHTGFLKRFSNAFGSNASSEGAFLASDYYVGKHGRSQRLIGLDPTNNNALDRAIVVHAAWYANPDVVRARGVLGRSQGCFAVGERDLAEVFDRLGTGRMIYAAKV